jgi:hypothetical protein
MRKLTFEDFLTDEFMKQYKGLDDDFQYAEADLMEELETV